MEVLAEARGGDWIGVVLVGIGRWCVVQLLELGRRGEVPVMEKVGGGCVGCG